MAATPIIKNQEAKELDKYARLADLKLSFMASRRSLHVAMLDYENNSLWGGILKLILHN